MRIAQVAPLDESVPPKLYGGTERVVAYLTDALVELGHDVTLFASGDSRTKAKLHACRSLAQRLDPNCKDPLADDVLQLEAVFRRAADFDVIHFHTGYMHYPLSRMAGISQVTTLHGRVDKPDLAAVFREYRDMPLISISDAQRAPVPEARWLGTVHHGLPRDLYGWTRRPEAHFAFLGRVCRDKGLGRAIEIARRCGRKLKVAAKIGDRDREYFHAVIEPMLADSDVEFIGEIGERDKELFLGSAAALLFPVDWPEPFGLSMIEAMACGTPVVAWRNGSIPEVVDAGVTGFVVDNLDEAVAAAKAAVDLDRQACRRRFELRFDARRMAGGYVKLYERVATGVSR